MYPIQQKLKMKNKKINIVNFRLKINLNKFLNMLTQ